MTPFTIGQKVVIVRSVSVYAGTIEQPSPQELQTNAVVGTVYDIREWEYSPNDIGVDFGAGGKWWFSEDELEPVS